MNSRTETPHPQPATRQGAAPLPAWPPPLGPEFLTELSAIMADPSQGETGPRAHAPMKQKRLFEQEFARYCGRRFAVAVNSGTTALDLAVEALELPSEAVVVAANYGHPATIRRAALTHRLRLVDVERRSLCMSAAALEQALAPGDVGLVLLTHFAGHTGDIEEIARLCASRGIPYIEDASHAHGAVFRDRPAGSFGTMACFSLHATKNLSCGEGGIIVLDDEAFFRRIWRRHDLGRDPEGTPYQFETIGGNFRLSEIAALEARHRLRTLPEQLSRRRAAAKALRERLDSSWGLEAVTGRPDDLSGCHIVPLWLHAESWGGMSRQRFILSLSAQSVPCSGGWPSPLDRLPGYRERIDIQSTPVTEWACAEQVWIDGRLLLQTDGVDRICDTLEQVKARHKSRRA